MAGLRQRGGTVGGERARVRMRCRLLFAASDERMARARLNQVMGAPLGETFLLDLAPAVAAPVDFSANVLDECPVLESARPSVAGRLEMSTPPIAATQPVETAPTTLSSISVHAHCATTVFERCTPLRI